MATTRELAEVLRQQYKGWNLDGPHGVLRYLDLAQNIFMDAPCVAHQYTDPTTGRFPSITASKTNRGPYDAPVAMKSIIEVLVLTGDTNTAWQNLAADYGMIRSRSTVKLQKRIWTGIEYVVFPYCRTASASQIDPPRVTFSIDPGRNTYYLYGLKKPPTLTTVGVDLSISPPWDEEFLLPAAGKLIEGVANGDMIGSRREVIAVLRPQYLQAVDGGQAETWDGEPADRGQ